MEGGTLLIYSDSQAAIKALKSNFECTSALDKLAEKISVDLVCVPGHSGIERNEASDYSETSMLGPESYSFSEGHKEIIMARKNEWTKNEYLHYWRGLTTYRQTKSSESKF